MSKRKFKKNKTKKQSEKEDRKSATRHNVCNIVSRKTTKHGNGHNVMMIMIYGKSFVITTISEYVHMCTYYI